MEVYRLGEKLSMSREYRRGSCALHPEFLPLPAEEKPLPAKKHAIYFVARVSEFVGKSALILKQGFILVSSEWTRPFPDF